MVDYITDTAGFEFPTGTGSAKTEYARAMVFIALDEATGEMLDVARLLQLGRIKCVIPSCHLLICSNFATAPVSA